MELYRQRIDGRSQTPEAAGLNLKIDQIERQLSVTGLVAERSAILRMARARRLDDEAAWNIREVDLL